MEPLDDTKLELERTRRRSERAENDLESMNVCIRMLTNQLISAETTRNGDLSVLNQTLQDGDHLATLIQRLPTAHCACLMALENAVHMVQEHNRLMLSEAIDQIQDSRISYDAHCAYWKKREQEAEDQVDELRAKCQDLHVQNMRLIKERNILCKEVRSLRKLLRETREYAKKKQFESYVAEALTMHELTLKSKSLEKTSSERRAVMGDPPPLLKTQEQAKETRLVLQEHVNVHNHVDEIPVTTPTRNGLGFGSHVALGYGTIGKNLSSPQLRFQAKARTERLPPRTEIVTPSPRHDFMRQFLANKVPGSSMCRSKHNETENIVPSIMKAPPKILKTPFANTRLSFLAACNHQQSSINSTLAGSQTYDDSCQAIEFECDQDVMKENSTDGADDVDDLSLI